MRNVMTGGVPRGLWGRAIDALVAYKVAGNAWVEAGRPRNCELYERFCAAETPYMQISNEIDRWDWSADQRAEWEAVHRRLDPLLPGQG